MKRIDRSGATSMPLVTTGSPAKTVRNSAESSRVAAARTDPVTRVPPGAGTATILAETAATPRSGRI